MPIITSINSSSGNMVPKPKGTSEEKILPKKKDSTIKPVPVTTSPRGKTVPSSYASSNKTVDLSVESDAKNESVDKFVDVSIADNKISEIGFTLPPVLPMDTFSKQLNIVSPTKVPVRKVSLDDLHGCCCFGRW